MLFSWIFKNAFDEVPKTILLQKLSAYGIEVRVGETGDGCHTGWLSH